MGDPLPISSPTMKLERRVAFADQFHLGLDSRFHFIFPIPIQKLDEQTPLLGFTEDGKGSVLEL